MFIEVQFTIGKMQKQFKCPSVNEWIKKMPVYTMEFHSAKKNVKCVFRKMNGTGGHHVQ
jgi:hypothetical protein